MENWYVPMTLVPGVGLLILSTANLMVALSTELSGLIIDQIDEQPIILRKMTQLKLLNLTMVFFYIAVACLAIAGVIGGLQIVSIKEFGICISIVGILIMLMGIFTLIKYSYRAVSIRQDQLKIKLSKDK